MKIEYLPHNGNRQPVKDGTKVWIRYRAGHEEQEPVPAEKRVWKWRTGDSPGEIVGYLKD